MALSKENQAKRKKRIDARYQKLCNVKKNGVQVYSHEYIMSKLEDEFFLEESTIMLILKS